MEPYTLLVDYTTCEVLSPHRLRITLTDAQLLHLVGSANRLLREAFHAVPADASTPGGSSYQRAGRNYERTTCPAGHPYDAANTYVYRNKTTGLQGRQGRACPPGLAARAE